MDQVMREQTTIDEAAKLRVKDAMLAHASASCLHRPYPLRAPGDLAVAL